MEKAKKNAKLMLCIAVALMLISSIVSYAIQTSGGSVTMKELNFVTDKGYTMSAYLLVPDSATAENPAPGIVTSHGYLNNKEMTDANYIELARRGFVVLAIDQPSHGDSEIPVGFALYGADGVYRGVKAMMGMPFVDKTQIGVTGHSMGGMSCNNAIAEDNAADEPLIAAVLLHNADPTITDADGNYADVYGSRDVGYMSAEYDEFFSQKRDEAGNVVKFSPHLMEMDTAQVFLNFGKEGEVREANTKYTETIDGKEAIRVIYREPIIHPWSHFAKRSETRILDFFTTVFDTPNPIDINNQVWNVKEAFNFVGVIGLVLFFISFATLLLFTPVFESLRAKDIVEPRPVKDNTGKLWFWCGQAVSAILCTVIYLSILRFGTERAVMQTESMGLGLWSTACGIIVIVSLIISYKSYGSKNGVDLEAIGVKMPAKKIGLSILLGVIVFLVGYGCVFVADYFFLSDFRLWTLAFKAFEAPILKFWPYMLLFICYYFAQSVAVNCFNYNTIGGKFNAIICSIFAAFPALIIPWIQYIHYYSTKKLLWYIRSDQMHVLWLFPIVLILIGSALLSRAIYKKSNNPYIAATINALTIGLITIINTCTAFP